MNKKEQNNKGFSLVELIIVIAIMAILIGVLAPQFIKFVEKSRESTDLQNVEEVKTAVETYVADHGESISAGTKYNVVLDKTAGTISTDCSVSEYGVTGTIPAKSKKWSGNISWQYDTSSYSWGSAPSVSGDYYKADGTPIK